MLRTLAPLIGCGLMMVVCMAVMARPGRLRRRQQPDQPTTAPEEIAALRDEVARLRRLDEERRAETEDPSR